MDIVCGKCDANNNVNDNDVDCSSNGSSGSHTTSYTYSANFTCWRCKRENDVTIHTDEVDDTREVLSSHIMYN